MRPGPSVRSPASPRSRGDGAVLPWMQQSVEPYLRRSRSEDGLWCQRSSGLRTHRTMLAMTLDPGGQFPDAGHPGDPDGWPYPDRHLATPHCPWCGWPAQLMAGANVHPMAWCRNDACEAFQWDPSIPARELVLNARAMVVEQDGETGVCRPETDAEQQARLADERKN